MIAQNGESFVEPREVRIHVVDDDESVLKAVTAVLGAAGLTAIPHSNAAEFLSSLSEDECACILLDLCMPEVQGLSVLQELRARFHRIPVVMMSGQADMDHALETLRCGAADFLEKPFLPDQLLACVRAAVRAAQIEFTHRERSRKIRRLIDGLTPREREVMDYLCRGKTPKQIAYELNVSHKTIQVHRARILDGMRVASVVELANVIHELDQLRMPMWSRRGSEMESE